MAALDLISLQLSLQRDAGRWNVGEPALLALPDGAPRQIPRGAGGEAGTSAGAASVAGRDGAGDLGARGFGWGSAGSFRIGGGASAALSRKSHLHFYNYRYWAGACP